MLYVAHLCKAYVRELGLTSATEVLPDVTAAQGNHCTALHLARRLAVAGQVRILDVDTPGLVMPVSVFARRDSPASTAVDTFRNRLVDAAARR